ncbi:MAG: lipocalin family protein [Gammaproteobacteria bacterium]|nr:lipocalin family protein [Gammaproteobacteria bacterium]
MKLITMISVFVLLQSCAHAPLTPLPRAENVDLDRFMGDWYVIANIPTFIEVGAHNAIESYSMNDNGSIKTSFSFYQGAFDGEFKTYHPTGYVSEADNSVWGMQFIWPFKAEYIIAYLSEDYQYTIIARSARDYVWVMSRTSTVDDSVYQSLLQRCVEMGYPAELIQKVPQQSGHALKQVEVKL